MIANRKGNVSRIVPILVAACVLAAAGPASSGTPKGACPIPPVAKKIPTVFHEQGKTRTDDDYWMRERATKPVLDDPNAENE